MSRTHGNQQKHESGNPIQRRLIARFHAEVTDLVASVSPTSVLEIGCGEGYVLSALRDAGIRADLTGIDLSAAAIMLARQRLGAAAELRVEDARDLVESKTTYDVVMMLEVLEHLEHPETILPTLGRLAARAIVLSVPWEPWFQLLNFLRLKNLRRLGNDPEHVNHWSRRGFRRFVEGQFHVRRVGHAFPWTLLLAEPND